MLTGLAGNVTLASLNTPYSPTSPAKSSFWSFGATSLTDTSDLYDDFQSNVSLKVSHGLSQAGAPTGLGIIYPTNEQKENQEDTAGFCKPGSGHDMVYRHRTFMRTETIYYDSQIGSSTLEEAPPEPLTLSSLLYQTELSPQLLDLISEEPVIEAIHDPVFLAATPEPSPPIPNEAQERWLLQRILEASGHTIETLSTELKARFQDSEPYSTDSHGWEAGLQTNAAYFQNAFVRLRESPVLGVNPADIMPPQPVFEPLLPLLPPPPETPLLAPVDTEDSELEPKGGTIPSHPALLFQQEPPSNSAPLTTQNLRLLEESTVPHKRESDYEPSLPFSASSSNESNFLPSFSKRNTRSRLAKAPKGHSVKRLLASPYTVPPPPNVQGPLPSNLPVNYGTPVLDAHRGIELSELKAKAGRYRLRNPSQEYDKKWLLSFAGKLTPQGLLTEEYRCYIVGCNQSNRRRDHILIHVGGHLDQRPFACTHCPARFLRKNECKRHELSHTGTRPFACDLCPFGTTAFVRQDLLKRHQKRTHNLDNSRSRTTKRQHHI